MSNNPDYPPKATAITLTFEDFTPAERVVLGDALEHCCGTVRNNRPAQLAADEVELLTRMSARFVVWRPARRLKG